MTADTNGAHFRPKVEGAGRLYNIYNPYFHWSQQVPNVFYEVGYGYGFSTSNLYQSTVSDSGVSRSLLATYPGAICLAKSVSPDGKKLIVFSYPQGTVYPTTVFPAFNIDVAAGYALDRDLGLYGNTPATVTQLHNQFVAGDGTWWFMEPEGSNAWWILQAVGSAADGGPFCDNSDFPVTDPDYDFGECIPGSTPGGSHPDPFGCEEWGHLCPDRWGVYALFSNGEVNPIGASIWDIENHEYLVETFGGGDQHNDWNGFTDWFVWTSGTPNDRIYTAKYDNPDSRVEVCYTHMRLYGGTQYFTDTRPGQSPDGTKVAWHSEFLNGQDATDCFWSVVYYPYPPTDLAASGSGGNIAVSFLPPKYTDRLWENTSTGFVDSVNGEVLYAREIKQYHVWRSSAGTRGWSPVGTVAAESGNDPVTNTLKPRVNGDWVSPHEQAWALPTIPATGPGTTR